MNSPATRPVSTWIGQFILLAALWGASFLFMRLGASDFGPLPTAGLRVALAFKPDARQAGGGGGQPHGPQRGVGPCLHGEGVKLHVEKSLEGDKGRFGAKSAPSASAYCLRRYGFDNFWASAGVGVPAPLLPAAQARSTA